jgi:hypothetical protein
LYYVLPWSITVSYVEYVVRIAPPLWNSWHSDTSHYHRSFLVPVLILTGIPICKRCCLDSILLATLLLWKLTIDSSFLGCWLLNRHSNIDLAA